MVRTKFIALLLCVFAGNLAYADHNPLLPRPQQSQYGAGSVSLVGAHIVIAASPSADDRFAAEELSKYIEERTGNRPAISEGGTDGTKPGPAITLERVGATDHVLALPGDLPGPDSSEAYDLTVSSQGITIHARSSAGVFYGIQTLRQMVEGQGSDCAIPTAEIHDWPSVAFRGTMVDISHGPLPREKEIERQLDFLARWKANQYYLYTENSIELIGYPLLNPDAQMTQDEVRQLVAYGRQRHVDVIPNFDLYAHQHDLFRIEEYSGLSDEPHGTEFDPTDPKVLPLLTDWANQFSELFPSKFVSIGFDETFQIAEAQTSAAAAAPTALFVKQLNVVAGLFQKQGKQVMAYDDIMVKYPQIIPELPKGLIAVAWYYTPEDPTYKRWLGPLVEHNVPHFVQPGVMSYDNIAPDYDTTFANIDTFLAAGRRSGALGLVNSVWSDDAQLLLRMSLPGMAYGAAAPWQSTPMDRASFFSDYARALYPANIAPDMANALSNMSNSETSLQKVLGNEQTMFSLWEDPFLPKYRTSLPAHRQDLHEERLNAEAAEESLMHAGKLGADPVTVNSLMIGSQLLDYAGEKFQTPLDLEGLWVKLGARHPDSERWWNEWESQVTHYDHSYFMDLMDRITDLQPAYRAEWLQEYQPYRMGTALGRWDAEFQYWRRVQDKVRNFNDQSHVGDRLPPLYTIIEGSETSPSSTK
jgi:hexosaminidase